MALAEALAVVQAAAALAFMIRYTMIIKWWKTISGRVVSGMMGSLFTITATLAATGTNETLSASPVLVSAGRIGFIATTLYGLGYLEYGARRRRKSGDDK